MIVLKIAVTRIKQMRPKIVKEQVYGCFVLFINKSLTKEVRRMLDSGRGSLEEAVLREEAKGMLIHLVSWF